MFSRVDHCLTLCTILDTVSSEKTVCEVWMKGSRIPAAYDSQRRTDWVQSLRRDQSCPFADRQEGRPKPGPNLRTASQGRDSRVRERRIQISPSFCGTTNREGQVMQPWNETHRSATECLRRFTRANEALNKIKKLTPEERREIEKKAIPGSLHKVLLFERFSM
jgi:hypothetical protein